MSEVNRMEYRGHPHKTQPWWESDEIRRLTELTEAQSRAIEALRQRNIALRDQQRGAVEERDRLRAEMTDIEGLITDRDDELAVLRAENRRLRGGQ